MALTETIPTAETEHWLQSIDVLDTRVGALFPSAYPQITRLVHRSCEGTIPEELVGPLVDVLGRCSEPETEVLYCVWDGWGGSIHRQDPRSTSPLRRKRRRIKEVRATSTIGPILRIPHREYLCFTGEIGDATQSHVHTGYHGASMWWPIDRSWFVATEVDATATYVGSSQECAELLQNSLVEATPANPTDIWMQ